MVLPVVGPVVVVVLPLLLARTVAVRVSRMVVVVMEMVVAVLVVEDDRQLVPEPPQPAFSLVGRFHLQAVRFGSCRWSPTSRAPLFGRMVARWSCLTQPRLVPTWHAGTHCSSPDLSSVFAVPC